jgi:hypothetical protein
MRSERSVDIDKFDEATANLETVADLASGNPDLHMLTGGALGQLLRMLIERIRDAVKR